MGSHAIPGGLHYHYVRVEVFGAQHGGSDIGTFKEPNCSNDVNHPSNAELIAEAEQAFAAAKRLVDEQSAIVWRLERTGGCNSEAIDLLSNLRELLAARERRLTRVLSWPSWDNAA